MRRVFLFPGQGAQYAGMAHDLWERSHRVKLLFDAASKATDMDLVHLLFEAGEQALDATDTQQVAVTVANLAASAYLADRGIHAAGYAGFSLGEYAALHEAGVIDTEHLFPLVKTRGRLMEAASRKLDEPDGPPGMAAVLGLVYEEVVPVLEDLRCCDVFLANHNGPVQVVLAGTAAGLAAAERRFDEAGALRFVRLRVSGPFHSPLLQEARDGLRAALADVPFHDPHTPVYSNVTGRRVVSGAEAKENLIRQVVSPVRWLEEERAILDDGYDQVLEVGPGTVLTGLWKSFYKRMRCLPAGTAEAIAELENAV
jgi:[acyl-carrier-protein] S-malonyltransferase